MNYSYYYSCYCNVLLFYFYHWYNYVPCDNVKRLQKVFNLPIIFEGHYTLWICMSDAVHSWHSEYVQYDTFMNMCVGSSSEKCNGFLFGHVHTIRTMGLVEGVFRTELYVSYVISVLFWLVAISYTLEILYTELYLDLYKT